MRPDSQADVIVIGAGISGLLVVLTAQAKGARVLVLDKGRGVGGRMATRRTGSGVFDHGAQFFTARDAQFRCLVEAWHAAGPVRPWATGFALADGAFKGDGETRFCGATGMTAIPKQLAQGLDLRVHAKVTCVQTGGNGWVVTNDAASLRRQLEEPAASP